MIDGEIRESQKIRNYSWVITSESRFAATKSHRVQLLSMCLAPPESPYATCLADGQKHQLWRTPVAASTGMACVNLEGTPVCYSPSQLSERIARVKRIIAGVGKVNASNGEPSRMLWPRLSGLMSPAELQELCVWWDRVRLEPLTRLACYLAPGKEECNVERNLVAAAD